MRAIAGFIHQALSGPDDPDNLAKLHVRSMSSAAHFPLYAKEWEV